MQKNKGFKVLAGETRLNKHLKMKGITTNTIDVKISGDDTDGKLAVLEIIGDSAFGGPPLHIHPFQDEWIYVIEGEYMIQVGDEKYRMTPGDTIFLPKNVRHAFMQISDQAKMTASFVPAGKMELFFKATDEWTSTPTAEEINRVFEDHEMTVVGLPLKYEKEMITSDFI